MELVTNFDSALDAGRYIRAMYMPTIYQQVARYLENNETEAEFVSDLPKDAVPALYTEITIKDYKATVADWADAGGICVALIADMLEELGEDFYNEVIPDYDLIKYGDDESEDWYKDLSWIEGYVMAVEALTTGSHKPTITKI